MLSVVHAATYVRCGLFTRRQTNGDGDVTGRAMVDDTTYQLAKTDYADACRRELPVSVGNRLFGCALTTTYRLLVKR